MDNPMTDAGELGVTDMTATAVVNRRDRALIIIAGDRLLDEVAPLRVRYREPRCCPYSLDLPMSRGRERSVGPGLEHREFDARRAGIDHEDRFVHALDLAWLGGQSAFIRARRGTDRCPRESRPGSRAPARPGESRPASDRVPSADKSRRPRRARSGTSLAASR